FPFVGAGILILFWDAPPWRSATGLLGLPSLLGLLPAAVGSGTVLALFLFFLKGGRLHLRQWPRHRLLPPGGVVLQPDWLTERQFLDPGHVREYSQIASGANTRKIAASHPAASSGFAASA